MSGFFDSSPIRILGASAVAVSGAADTNENILGTVTIPAGAMGLNGILRVRSIWTVTSSTNSKTLRHRFSGIGGTQYTAIAITATLVAVQMYSEIFNRNSLSSQVGTGWTPRSAADLLLAGAVHSTSAVDTSAATTLVFTGQKATAGEACTLEAYMVELILP